MNTQQIVEQVKQTKTLELNYTGFDDVTEELVEVFESLIEQQIEVCKIHLLGLIFDGQKIFNQLEKFTTKLEYLGLEQCLSIEQNQLKNFLSLSVFRNLRTLNLSQCKINDEHLQAIIENQGLKLNLTKIQVSFCKLISNEGIQLLINNCLKIKEWDLKGTAVTDEVFKYFLESTNTNLNVQYLNLCKCTLLTGSGLKNFLEKGSQTILKNLKYLDIACTNIDEQGVKAIKNVQKSLQKLKIYECDFATKESFEYLFQNEKGAFDSQNELYNNKIFQNLREIDFSWSEFSGEALRMLQDNDILQNLEEFIIPRCKNIGAKDFDYLQKNVNFSSAKVMNVSFNGNGSKNLVKALGQQEIRAPNLTQLECYEVKFTDEEIQNLEETFEQQGVLLLA